MSSLHDLAEVICKRLNITDSNQIRCITNILGDTIAFSDYRRDGLDEARLDHLVRVMGGFVSEIRDVTDDPTHYDNKLKKIREMVKRRECELT